MEENEPKMFCELHHRQGRWPWIDWSEFGYKGCWNCQHFGGLDKDFVFTYEAAELLGQSLRTICRWCQKGRLKAKLFRRTRVLGFGGAPTKWVITRESVDRERAKLVRNQKKSPRIPPKRTN